MPVDMKHSVLSSTQCTPSINIAPYIPKQVFLCAFLFGLNRTIKFADLYLFLKRHSAQQLEITLTILPISFFFLFLSFFFYTRYNRFVRNLHEGEEVPIKELPFSFTQFGAVLMVDIVGFSQVKIELRKKLPEGGCVHLSVLCVCIKVGFRDQLQYVYTRTSNNTSMKLVSR